MKAQSFSALTLHESGVAPEIDGKTIMITGGTGSFGKQFISTVFKYFSPKCVIVFSRDEFKQHQMKTGEFNEKKYPNLHYVLGDVRNRDRIFEILRDYEVDVVVHTAAIKHVDISEKNPTECIETNIMGTINLAEACKKAKVKKVLALSTDKCVDPINIYGATKLCLERVVTASNNFSSLKEFYNGNRANCSTLFSVVRYGNVLGSRGSVVHVFTEQIKNGLLKATNMDMTRFTLLKSEAVSFALNCIWMMTGGEVFVPELPSYSLGQLIRVMKPTEDFPVVNIGVRPGEKLHECMISNHESHLATRFGIAPNKGFYLVRSHYFGNYIDYKFLYSKLFDGQNIADCEENWSYTSDLNLKLEDSLLKALIALVLREN